MSVPNNEALDLWVYSGRYLLADEAGNTISPQGIRQALPIGTTTSASITIMGAE